MIIEEVKSNYVWKKVGDDIVLVKSCEKDIDNEKKHLITLSRMNKNFPYTVYVKGKENKKLQGELPSDNLKEIKDYILKNIDKILGNKINEDYNVKSPLDYIEEKLQDANIDYTIEQAMDDRPYDTWITINDGQDSLADEIICSVVGYAYEWVRDRFGNRKYCKVATNEDTIHELNENLDDAYPNSVKYAIVYRNLEDDSLIDARVYDDKHIAQSKYGIALANREPGTYVDIEEVTPESSLWEESLKEEYVGKINEVEELKGFEDARKELGLTDEDIKVIKNEIIKNPNSGNVIQGTGGARKIRVALKNNNKGKSAGARIVYINIYIKEKAYLIMIFAKSNSANLTSNEKKLVKNIVDFIKNK